MFVVFELVSLNAMYRDVQLMSVLLILTELFILKYDVKSTPLPLPGQLMFPNVLQRKIVPMSPTVPTVPPAMLNKPLNVLVLWFREILPPDPDPAFAVGAFPPLTLKLPVPARVPAIMYIEPPAPPPPSDTPLLPFAVIKPELLNILEALM